MNGKRSGFAHKLNKAVAKRGWTAAAFAAKVDVDPSYMRRILRGERLPTRHAQAWLARILDALGVDDTEAAELRDAWTKALDPSDSNKARAQVASILGVEAITPTRPAIRELHIDPRQIHFRGFWFDNAEALVQELFSKAGEAKELFLSTDLDFLTVAGVSGLISEFCVIAERVIHCIPGALTEEQALQVVEVLMKVHSRAGISSERYLPYVGEADPKPLPFSNALVYGQYSCFILSVDRAKARFYAILTHDTTVSRSALENIQSWLGKSRQLFECYGQNDKEETHLAFQRRSLEIESRSTFRHGVFDEGFSFVSQPEAWYHQDSPFLKFTPHESWMPPDKVGVYRQILIKRIKMLGRAYRAIEIVSEEKVVNYLRYGSASVPGAAGKLFYHEAFPAKFRWEHVRNICELLRDKTCRYSMLILKASHEAISNKSWVVYDEAVSFGHIAGEDNIRMIIDNKAVAGAFETVFQDLSTLTNAALRDRDRVCDWLLARAVEHIPE